MGMAAGQARLLSITSRMSDNELRAQLINNDKMRLATKSAQVSEAYTNALNDAQLMFTNYDKDNNTSYKELTFNSLTAYNQYNNQYAISNSAGQLLVSEKDAKNFEKSSDLKSFLECYGLENTTTYFDKNNLGKNSGVEYYIMGTSGQAENAGISKGVIYNTGYLAEDANGVSRNIQVDSGYTAEDLQKMYDGVDGYTGYMKIKASDYYYNYSSALANFKTAQETYSTSAANVMSKLVDTITVDSKSLSQISSEMNASTNIDDVKEYLKMIQGAIDGTGEYAGKNKHSFTEFSTKDQAVTDYYNSMKSMISDSLNNKSTITSGFESSSDGNTIYYDKEDEGGFQLTKNGTEWTVQFYTKQEDSSDANPKYVLSDTKYPVTNAGGKLSFTNGLEGDERIEFKDIPTPELASDGNYTMPSGYKVTEYSQLDIDDLKTLGQQVINSLKNSTQNTFDISTKPYKYKWTAAENGGISYGNEEVTTPEYTAYKTAAENLYKAIFGTDMNGKLNETQWASLTNVNAIETLGQKFATDAFKQQFENIKQVEILDGIMNTYGEPQYDWIDTSNKNENGSAKAQWYTNLYNKMNTSGYKALHDGLASSAEWMQFAFESGLVCLEQVDTNNNWNTTTYTNCSDITEQTNNTAITKAEAEYNAAMAKIENKDKRYDLELKNIDTEHNSLQTEYESIKNAIDKNIERTFKIYS